MLELVTIQKLAAESGYTEDAIRSKIARGEFAEGLHYIKSPDGRIHFYVEEYLKWLKSNTDSPGLERGKATPKAPSK
jgi:ubiquinone biosynthesis protein COQ9